MGASIRYSTESEKFPCFYYLIIIGLFTMRGYSVTVAALALEVDRKWLDNLLSQNRVPGVRQARQGVQRRLTAGSLHVIEVIWRLNNDLGVPVRKAVEIASKLWESPDRLELGPIHLSVDAGAIEAGLAGRLSEAVEIAPRTRRGRPPKARRQ